MRGKKNAITQARKLLSQSGQKKPPVHVERIAQNILKINVFRHRFDSNEMSGLFFRKGNSLFLGVNDNHPERRQRFTIAHEIGHYVLHVNETLHYDKPPMHNKDNYLDNVYYRAEDVLNDDEREANYFAAELLMPEEFVVKLIDKGIRAIHELAEAFNVSEDAMRYRLTNLGYL